MTRGRVQTIAKAVHDFTRLVYLIGGASCMIGLILLIVIDVGLRYLFNSPITWSYEIVMYMMVIVVATALVYCETQKGHVQIELLYNVMPKFFQKILPPFHSFFIMILFFLIAWQNVVRAKGLRKEGLTSTILQIPTYPFYLVMAFGCALLGTVVLTDILSSLLSAKEE